MIDPLTVQAMYDRVAWALLDRGVMISQAPAVAAPHVLTLRFAVSSLRRVRESTPEIVQALGASEIRTYFDSGLYHLQLAMPREGRETLGVWRKPAGQRRAVIGCDELGQPVLVDLSVTPHWLIAGQTKSGKSTVLRVLVYQLARDEDTRLALVDSDADTWAGFERAAGLLAPVASTVDEAQALVLHVQDILNGRTGPAAPVILAVDEARLADSVTHAALLDIAARGAKRCVHLLLSTQYVNAKALDRFMTDQFAGRIAGRVQDPAASRQILGAAGPSDGAQKGGAEILTGYGDLLIADYGRVRRILASFVQPSDLSKLPQAHVLPQAPVDRATAVHPGRIREDDSEAIEWALANWPTSARQIQQAMGVGMDRARRVRDAAAAAVDKGGYPLTPSLPEVIRPDFAARVAAQ